MASKVLALIGSNTFKYSGVDRGTSSSLVQHIFCLVTFGIKLDTCVLSMQKGPMDTRRESCRRRRHPTKGDLCVFAQNDSRNGMSLSAHVIPTSQDPTRGTRAGKNIHHMLAIKNRTHLFKGISDREQKSILETYA